MKPGSDAMPSKAATRDRYQLSGEIARGGMGAVLRGRDVDLGRDLAVKILLEKYLDRPEVARRFIEEAVALLGTLFTDLNNNKENTSLVTQIKLVASEIMVMLRDTCATLDAAPYPYEHGSGTISIGADFVPAVPGPEEFGELFGAVQGLVAKYYSLDYRLMGELIVLAERIETAIGLEVLADPPEIPSA